MSGFLHRLAAQAIGRTSTLRSVARQPYAAAPEPEHDTVWATTNTEQHKPASSMTNLHAVPAQTPRRVDPDKKISTPHREQKMAGAPPEIVVAPTPSAFATQPDHPYAPPPPGPATLRPASVENTTAQEPPLLVEETATHNTVNHSTTRFTTASDFVADDKTYAALTDSAVPAPLLPLKKAAPPAASHADAPARRSEARGFMPQSSVEETTEVHVNIGRIEVTAIHEAPPTKRPAPTAARPMSLDEYLLRRRRAT